MATRKKPRRPQAPKNSKITEAQQAVSSQRIEKDTLRGQAGAARQATQKNLSVAAPAPKPNNDAFKLQAAQAAVDPRAPRPPISQQFEKKGPPSSAGQEVAGLALSFSAPEQIRAMADPSLYGNPAAARAAKLNELSSAVNALQQQQFKKSGKYVYMGQRDMKQSMTGRQSIDPETGKRTQVVGSVDDIQSVDDMIGWLADPQKVEQIKAVALKAGLAVQSYDDIAKLWGSVVQQAATTYSKTSQKVTPWALIAMRGKYAGPGGQMQDKVTTSTQIDELDPAQARQMLESTATQMLGRAPTTHELDDFIAKAQMIAKSNPAVTTTRSKVGFDGQVQVGTDQTTTKGGLPVVKAQAEVAAADQAKQSDDYGAFQAAGTYFPLLFQALSAPV